MRFGLCSIFFWLWLVLSGKDSFSEEVPDLVFLDSTDVEIAGVEVSVVGRDGLPIPGLTREDFELFVDGDSKVIDNFYEVGEAEPSVVSIFIDSAGAQIRYFLEIKDSLKNLARHFVESGYYVQVVVYRDRLYEVQSFSRDLSEIYLAIDSSSMLFSGLESFGSLRNTARLLGSMGPDLAGGSGSFCGDQARSIAYSFGQEEYFSSRSRLFAIEEVVLALGGFSGRKIFFYFGSAPSVNPLGDVFEVYQGFCGDGSSFGSSGPIVGADPSRPRESSVVSDNFSSSDSGSDSSSDSIGHSSGFIRGGGSSSAGNVDNYVVSFESFGRVYPHFNLTRNLERVIAAANRSRVVLLGVSLGATFVPVSGHDVGYSFRVPSLGLGLISYGGREDTLLSLSKSTGGEAVLRSSSLDKSIERIVDWLGHYYSIGFTVDGESRNKRMRVKVKVKLPGVHVRHRSDIALKGRIEALAEKVTAALLWDDSEDHLGLRVHFTSLKPVDEKTSSVVSWVEIPMKNILLLPGNNGSFGRVKLLVASRDEMGRFSPVRFVDVPVELLETESNERLYVKYWIKLLLRRGKHSVVFGAYDEIGRREAVVRKDVFVD